MQNSSATPKLLLGALLPVVALAAFVQVTGVGIDLLLLAVAILLLLTLERSVGDWIAEWFGPFAAAAIFGVLILSLSWYFLSSSLGRSKTDRFFMEAERRGYRTVYYETPGSPAAEETPPAASSAPARPATPPAATGPLVAGTNERDTPRSAGSAAKTPNEGRDTAALESSGKDAPTPATSAGKPSRSASGWAGSLFRRDTPAGAAIPTTTAVSVSPARVAPAYRTTITATVSAASGPVARGTVEFMVNGLGAGRKPVTDGTASTTFVPQIAGTYEVRARFVGTSEHAASSSSLFTLEVGAKR